MQAAETILKVPKRKTFILVQVKNNTLSNQNIVLFDVTGAYNSQNAIAGTTTFSADLTADIANATAKGLYTVAVLAIAPGQTTYQLYTANNEGNAPFTTVSQVLTALNNLGIGTFYQVAGNNIAVQSMGYTYSNISLTQILTAAHDSAIFGNTYTTGGSLIYDPGFTQGLVGNFTQISLANAFWKNTGGSFNGPYNRSSIYANNVNDIDLSLFANINMSTARTVYIGISFSVYVGFNLSTYTELYVNGQKIVDITSNATLTAMAANVNGILGTAYTNSNISFVCWHIIPVSLTAGNNVIQMIDKSNSGIQVDAMGIEVYDNTAAEIQAATSYSELNLLFSGIQYSGSPLF